MDRLEEANEFLAKAKNWTYLPHGPSQSEPAALTSMALLQAGNSKAALAAVDWLATIQQPDGSVGTSAEQSKPQWPTSLALNAWATWQQVAEEDRFATNLRKGLEWTLQHQGKTAPNRPGIGHDTTLLGWPWAANTHAWLEPTAMFVSALIRNQKADHPRTREAVRLLLNRQLPQGGFNYGNTFVLGQRLLSHIQPTGIALTALAHAGVDVTQVQHSLDYLRSSCREIRSTASVCHATMGLASYGQSPDYLADKLSHCLDQEFKEPVAYKVALISLAVQSRMRLKEAKENLP